MKKLKNIKPGLTYETVTGKIEYNLQNDMMFHYVMQESKEALKGLVCALKGISPSEVQAIHVENPIELNNTGRETIMDVKLTLNTNEIMNIELQMYYEPEWLPRSVLYLCRAYDSIGRGDDYTLLKPTTLYCITDKKLVPGAEPKFYAKYQLLNVKSHKKYTDMIGVNVLQLDQTDIATKEDKDNNLVYWANLFKATTWEDFKALAKDDPAIKEVGTMIFELNYDNQAKELLEGQRRYREKMATEYAAGVRDAKKEMQGAFDALESKLENSEQEKAEMKAKYEESESEIARLRALLKEHGISGT